MTLALLRILRIGRAAARAARVRAPRPPVARASRGAPGRIGASSGLSMVEMIITLTILAMVVAALTTVLLHATLSRLQSGNRFESLQTARVALDLIATDLRSAGYGVDATNPAGAQPAIAYVDSLQILVCENQSPYPDSASGSASPQAYDPSGSPRPQPLVASAWTPPIKYRTGAEIVRYTLDLDDDGQVNANDVASAQGADARRSKNPDDFTLVREVYGAGSGGQATNNGGVPERVALVLKPGNGVPALFTVYLNGSSTPWDWALGPIPANQLASITRVLVHITASSGHPDTRGAYARTLLETAVGSMRNTPSFGASSYTVDGYVYDDADHSGGRNTGEAGLAGAAVRLGSGRVAYTTSTGYFSFRVPAGHFVLRHFPPAGYGSFSSPDTFSIDLAGNETRSFGDTARTGGWVSVNVWDDADADGIVDAGEAALAGVTLTASPGGTQATTDASGLAQMFLAAGAWSISAAPPANYTTTTTTPVTGTMSAGGTGSASYGMRQGSSGTVHGTVFHDLNANGVYDGTDTGIAGVTVTLTSGGSAIATATTDGTGAYSFTVSASGGGTVYGLTCPAQGGYYPSTGLAIASVTVTSGGTVTGKDFGFASFASQSFTTGAVLGIVAKDFYENDRTGGTYPSTNGDVDLAVTMNDHGTYKLVYYINGYPGTTFTSGGTQTGTMAFSPRAVAADTTTSGAKTPEIFLANTSTWYFWRRVPGSTSSTTPPLASSRTYDESGSETLLGIVTIDCTGGAAPDILTATRSASGAGKVHVWSNDNTSFPDFGQAETYPASGGIPGAHMGEANAMLLADLNGDGSKDLIIGTQTSSTSGEIIVMKNSGRTNGNRFVYQSLISVGSDAVKALAAVDVDGDGRLDIVAGTSTSSSAGHVLVYRNTYATSPWTFSLTQTISAPGAVNCLASGDFGSTSATDLAIGFTSNSATSAGGVRMLYSDGSALSTTFLDPTGGSVANSVTALAAANFNYATYPSVTAAPYLTDLAIGWQGASNAGGLLVLVR